MRTKSTLTTLLLLLLSLAGIAQTTPGFFIGSSIGSTNLDRDKRMLFDIMPEVGYQGKIFGAGLKYESSLNLYKDTPNDDHRATSIGIRLYGKVLQFDGISLSLTAEADRIINPIDDKMIGDWKFAPGVLVAVPIYKTIDAGIGLDQTIYKQYRLGKPMVKERKGIYFRFVYRIPSKKRMALR